MSAVRARFGSQITAEAFCRYHTNAAMMVSLLPCALAILSMRLPHSPSYMLTMSPSSHNIIQHHSTYAPLAPQ